MTALLTALETASCWLVQPCTECTCTKAAVRDLDVDPDCPGLHPAADGCRSHSHVAARIALADAGIPVQRGTRDWLRRTVLAMYLDLSELAECPTSSVSGGLDPRLTPAPLSSSSPLMGVAA